MPRLIFPFYDAGDYLSSSESTEVESVTPNKIFGKYARSTPTVYDKASSGLSKTGKAKVSSAGSDSSCATLQLETNDKVVRHEESDNSEVPIPRSRGRKPAQKVIAEISSEEDLEQLPQKSSQDSHNKLSEDQNKTASPEKARYPSRRSRGYATDQRQSYNANHIDATSKRSLEKADEIFQSDSDDSLMKELRTPIKKPGRKLIPLGLSRKESISDFALTVSSGDDDDDSSDDVRASSRRRKSTTKKPDMRREKVITKKSARQKQLEILKKRRAGRKASDIPSERESDIEMPSDHPADEDEATEDSDTAAMRQAISVNLDEYDDDFIDYDDDRLGTAAELDDMPLEFTRHAHKKPIDHFKDAVEWMIHNKLNPAFARNDTIYRIAFFKLDDEVQGYSGSKFLSAAWNSKFLKALKSHPDLQRIDVPTMFDHKCEACNRSNHPAKHQVTFSGSPYHRESLEEVSSEDGSAEEDNTSRHKTYLLGRTCNANAETAHALYHWRYHLNQYVLDWLKRHGHTAPEKIVEREGWSVNKRANYANDVVDGMEEDGEMKILYKEFKENLAAARDAKVGVCSYLN